MTPGLPVDPVAIAAVALVTATVAVRLYAGGGLLSLRFLSFWARARQVYMPVLDRIGKRLVGIGAENRARRDEFVADVADAMPADVAAAVADAATYRTEVSVLSGLKTDWTGNVEVASVVAYAGPKPFPGAPDWLRDDQLHVFMFEDRGRVRVCAHYEANSWRPDKWRDHLFKGETFDAETGVRNTRAALVVDGLVHPVSRERDSDA